MVTWTTLLSTREFRYRLSRTGGSNLTVADYGRIFLAMVDFLAGEMIPLQIAEGIPKIKRTNKLLFINDLQKSMALFRVDFRAYILKKTQL